MNFHGGETIMRCVKVRGAKIGFALPNYLRE